MSLNNARHANFVCPHICSTVQTTTTRSKTCILELHNFTLSLRPTKSQIRRRAVYKRTLKHTFAQVAQNSNSTQSVPSGSVGAIQLCDWREREHFINIIYALVHVRTHCTLCVRWMTCVGIIKLRTQCTTMYTRNVFKMGICEWICGRSRGGFSFRHVVASG